jgi:unsaturated chondroitin disaccharide hydrolase
MKWMAIVFSACVFAVHAEALNALPDAAITLPNASATLAVLTNDVGPASNQIAILRVTQPAHGRVVINSAASVTNSELDLLFHFAATQLSNTVSQVGDTNLYPWVTMPDGNWDTAPIGDNNWISGFFPGSLWLIYEHTGDTNFRAWAESWTAGIAPEQFSTNVDDVGFMINTSFGNGYRMTSNAVYKAALLQAAQSLTNRFNDIVGCLADDRLLTPPSFEVILDTMMNSELLYHARDLGGDTNLATIAARHAEKTILNHLRADGSMYHMVIYNSTNGEVMYQGNRAIDPPLDTWARGLAWATYGFTMAFRETGDARFLETARRTAEFYSANAQPDFVPYWYYPSNGTLPNPPLRDSSAAAITLSALVELSQLETNALDAAQEWQLAQNIFASLASTNYLAQATTNRGILLHGDSVDTGTDASLIYGDYYFIEALKRLNDVYRHTTLTYVPETNFTGTDSFTYQVCDSSGATSTAMVSVTVGFVAQISFSPGQGKLIWFPTSTSNTYFIQYADELFSPMNWSPLTTNIAGTGAMISVTDTNPSAQRFYRIGSVQ